MFSSITSRSSLSHRVTVRPLTLTLRSRTFSSSTVYLKPSLETPSSPTPSSPTPSIPPSKPLKKHRPKGEGTIASVFATLSGDSLGNDLPSRFSALKRSLIRDQAHANVIKASFKSTLEKLNTELEDILRKGERIIPQVEYPGHEIAEQGLEHWMEKETLDQIRKTGAVIVKGVVDEKTALAWKEGIREYVRANPQVKGFPENDPQVFELYWSKSQVEARSNAALLRTSQAFLQLFHAPSQDSASSHFKDSTPPTSLSVSLSNPLMYADRLRIRHPGDSKFALGPHIDGGGVERWECESFRGVFKSILQGSEWQTHDPWSLGPSAERLAAQTDMYGGAGQCSVFRPLQGWMSMSETGANEGTLRVLPNLKEATAYIMLRPFFKPKSQRGAPTASQTASEEYLNVDNWEFDASSSSFPGCSLGHNIELSPMTHPHLRLDRSMTSIPKVNPGDMALWHCDVVHSVEAVHSGKGDSSVMYIPAIPLTENNFDYILAQRSSFENGTPPSDFPGGEGEASFNGRAEPQDVPHGLARRSMGLEKFEIRDGMPEAEKKLLEACNAQI